MWKFQVPEKWLSKTAVLEHKHPLNINLTNATAHLPSFSYLKKDINNVRTPQLHKSIIFQEYFLLNT